jgi:hypothetical protein
VDRTWFISYAAADSWACRYLADDLRQSQLETWHYDGEIGAGTRLRDSIYPRMERCAGVLVLLSPRAIRSRWVLNELDAAMTREIGEGRDLIIPILIGRIRDEQIPLDLRGKRYIDLRHNFNARYRERRAFLVSSMQRMSEQREVEPRHFPMGAEAVAALLERRFRPVCASDPPKDLLSCFVDWFQKPEFWNEWLSALTDFRERFGLEVIRELLIVCFRFRRIDFESSFSADQIDEAFSEAKCFIILADIHHAEDEGGRPGISVQVRSSSGFLFRRLTAGHSPSRPALPSAV